MSNYKFWCQSCAVYDQNPCPNIGHISERLYRVGPNWRRYPERKFVIASPPEGGRGGVTCFPCNEMGERPMKKA